MKPFLFGVVALVIGIVAGAWQPRGELLAMRAELDELRARQVKCGRGNAAAGIRELLRAAPPDLARAERDQDEGQDDPPGPTSSPAERATPEGGTAPTEQPENATEAAEMLGTALDARRAQARAALAEQADLDDAELTALDAAMDDMNRKLKAEVDRFVEKAVAEGELDRREMMDFAAESLDIVIAGDDALRAALPEEAYESAEDSAVDPFSYLSGETLESLARLDDMALPDEGE